jgi:cellulose synthase/poly-beta-1,6-N-acetylglucosamine synthase-like glycosyltransferase
MIILLSVTACIILFYLAYPLWLATLPRVMDAETVESKQIDGISLVLLSFNGCRFLKEKINVLLDELSAFQDYELIIIDDHSADGSCEMLRRFSRDSRIKVILKEQHKGIPDSMNMAVECAKYDYIVFCDQRQDLSEKIIRRLVEPLCDSRIGAVSACISDHDKSNYYSRLRTYENYIKYMESRSGSLVGVYGPLYAIRKSSYTPIPSYIILDDLYLSLKILATRQVRIMKECMITDESPSRLNDYQRARRYVKGFLQIVREKGLINSLPVKQRIMLTWHKYIPVLLLASYVAIGIMSFTDKTYLLLFIFLTGLAMIFPLPLQFKIHARIKDILKINFFYCFAILEVGIRLIFQKRTLRTDD